MKHKSTGLKLTSTDTPNGAHQTIGQRLILHGVLLSLKLHPSLYTLIHAPELVTL